MLKKWQLIYLVVGMLIFTAAPSVSANNTNVSIFDVIDIDTHWAVNQMTHMVAMGVVKGYAATYYDSTQHKYVQAKKLLPDTKITRAEFAVLVYQALNLAKTDQNAPFGDKDKIPSWAVDAVNSLYHESIMAGNTEGLVKPTSYITRAEIAAILVKSMHDKSQPQQTKDFPDVSKKHWAYNAIQKAFSAGVIAGKPTGEFAPDSYARRGEVMTMLYNMMAKDRIQVPTDDTLLKVTDEYMDKSAEVLNGAAPYDLTKLSGLLTGNEAAMLSINNDALNDLASRNVTMKYEVLSKGTVQSKSDWLAEVTYTTRLTYSGLGDDVKYDLVEHVYLMNINGQWLIYYIPSKDNTN